MASRHLSVTDVFVLSVTDVFVSHQAVFLIKCLFERPDPFSVTRRARKREGIGMELSDLEIRYRFF
jgi:hypothetical protein